MGFFKQGMDKWARACDGRGPDVPRNGRDDLMIAQACIRNNPRIHKFDHLDNVRRSVHQQSGVYLTEEETEELVQEVYDEKDMGKIPFWNVWNERKD